MMVGFTLPDNELDYEEWEMRIPDVSDVRTLENGKVVKPTGKLYGKVVVFLLAGVENDIRGDNSEFSFKQ